MTAGGGRQQNRFDELVRQIGELTRAVDRSTINTEVLVKKVDSLDRWARSGSNGDGPKTAEARIQRLENERDADRRYETKQAQKITWLIALTAILSAAATGIILRLMG